MFFGGALTGPYPTLQFDGACGLGGGWGHSNEINMGPETEVDLMVTNVKNVPYATILLLPLCLPLFHHSHHIFR